MSLQFYAQFVRGHVWVISILADGVIKETVKQDARNDLIRQN